MSNSTTSGFKFRFFIWLALLVVPVASAYAGACLCLKSKGDEITEFSCKNVDGNNACGQHCEDTDFPGSEYYQDESCNSLRDKIKRQEIEVPVPILDITSSVVEIVDVATGEVVSRTTIPIVESDQHAIDGAVVGDTENTSTTPINNPQPVPGPGQVARRIIEATGEFVGGVDTFDVPRAFGGGRHTTNSFGGEFTLQLVQRIDNSDLYDVYVMSIDTIAPSMNLNGTESGVLRGSLNLDAPNQGLYNDATGDITLLFSQFLVSDSLPEEPMLTYTTYSGNCPDCLNGRQFTLYGDSLYVSPVP